MSEEVNKIIDNLCTKLGTSAKYLVPELARMHIAEDVVTIIITIIITVILLKVTPKVWAYDHRDDLKRYEDSFWIIIPGTIGVITFVFMVTAIGDLAGWIASPTAKGIQVITRLIK